MLQDSRQAAGAANRSRTAYCMCVVAVFLSLAFMSRTENCGIMQRRLVTDLPGVPFSRELSPGPQNTRPRSASAYHSVFKLVHKLVMRCLARAQLLVVELAFTHEKAPGALLLEKALRSLDGCIVLGLRDVAIKFEWKAGGGLWNTAKAMRKEGGLFLTVFASFWSESSASAL